MLCGGWSQDISFKIMCGSNKKSNKNINIYRLKNVSTYLKRLKTYLHPGKIHNFEPKNGGGWKRIFLFKHRGGQVDHPDNSGNATVDNGLFSFCWNSDQFRWRWIFTKVWQHQYSGSISGDMKPNRRSIKGIRHLVQQGPLPVTRKLQPL